MQTFWQDLRYALRQLRKAPGFAIIAVITLSLGIGVTSTVASLVRQVLLSPLPYAAPDQLVGVAMTWPEESPNAEETGATADFVSRYAQSFSNVAWLDDGSTIANLSQQGHADSIHVLGVSRGFFPTLQVSPLFGRGFTAQEDSAGGPPALVLSYGFWQQAFGSDRSIIGKTLRLNQKNITVVGVLPPDFRYEASASRNTLGPPDAYRTLQLGPKSFGYDGDNFQLFARLKPGVTAQQAEQELSALQPAVYKANPTLYRWKNEAGKNPGFRVWPLAKVLAGDVHDSLLVMTWASVAVLLLACLNLAGLNTARAVHRAPEFALRATLGADRGRLLRLALLETGLLTLTGVAGAVIVVRLLLPFLLKASPIPIPQLNGHAGIWSTAAEAALFGCVGAFVFGLPLAITALRRSGTNLVKSTRTVGMTLSQMRAGRVLIVLQMSLAVLLVSAASLLLGTFLRLRSQPTGFQPEKLVVFQTNLKGDRYASTATTTHFVAQVLNSLQHSPGVVSAAAINGIPMDRGLNSGGWPGARTDLTRNVEFRSVTPGYLKTMGLQLLEGRDFNDADSATSLPVTVISASTAHLWWPDRSPIGDVIHTGTNPPMQIIGVAADAPGNRLADRPDVMMYAPIPQVADDDTKAINGWFPTSFAVRVAAQIDTSEIIRNAVSTADPEIPVANLTTMEQMIDHSVAAPRFFTQLAEGFAAFGVLLTAIGLFGLLSYQVAQQRREIGIRMALGASRKTILLGVLRSSGNIALLGGVIGIAGALLLRPVLAQWIAKSVIAVDSVHDPLLFNNSATILGAAFVLIVTALVASLLPARRAAKIEPMEALRTE